MKLPDVAAPKNVNPLLDDRGRGRDPFRVPVSALEPVRPSRVSAKTVVSRHNREGSHSYPTNVALTGLRDLLCKPCTERDEWSFGGGEHVAQTTAIRYCPITTCPVWPFRTGRNPFSARRGVRPTFGKAAT